MMAVPVKTTAAGESRYFSSSGYSSLTTRQLPTVAAMFLALIERFIGQGYHAGKLIVISYLDSAYRQS